jgi:predicted secreted protein
MEPAKILVMAMVVLAAAAASAFGGGPDHVVLTKNDDGKQISVPLGSIVEVKLEQAGGTGYLWKTVDLDTAHLEEIGSGTEPLSKPPVVGGPILVTWRFKAVGKGQAELKMLLMRSWEGPEKAARKFQVELLVN